MVQTKEWWSDITINARLAVEGVKRGSRSGGRRQTQTDLLLILGDAPLHVLHLLLSVLANLDVNVLLCSKMFLLVLFESHLALLQIHSFFIKQRACQGLYTSSKKETEAHQRPYFFQNRNPRVTINVTFYVRKWGFMRDFALEKQTDSPKKFETEARKHNIGLDYSISGARRPLTFSLSIAIFYQARLFLLFIFFSLTLSLFLIKPGWLSLSHLMTQSIAPFLSLYRFLFSSQAIFLSA